jgi:hypothetical protein
MPGHDGIEYDDGLGERPMPAGDRHRHNGNRHDRNRHHGNHEVIEFVAPRVLASSSGKSGARTRHPSSQPRASVSLSWPVRDQCYSS